MSAAVGRSLVLFFDPLVAVRLCRRCRGRGAVVAALCGRTDPWYRPQRSRRQVGSRLCGPTRTPDV